MPQTHLAPIPLAYPCLTEDKFPIRASLSHEQLENMGKYNPNLSAALEENPALRNLLLHQKGQENARLRVMYLVNAKLVFPNHYSYAVSVNGIGSRSSDIASVRHVMANRLNAAVNEADSQQQWISHEDFLPYRSHCDFFLEELNRGFWMDISRTQQFIGEATALYEQKLARGKEIAYQSINLKPSTRKRFPLDGLANIIQTLGYPRIITQATAEEFAEQTGIELAPEAMPPIGLTPEQLRSAVHRARGHVQENFIKACLLQHHFEAISDVDKEQYLSDFLSHKSFNIGLQPTRHLPDAIWASELYTIVAMATLKRVYEEMIAVVSKHTKYDAKYIRVEAKKRLLACEQRYRNALTEILGVALPENPTQVQLDTIQAQAHHRRAAILHADHESKLWNSDSGIRARQSFALLSFHPDLYGARHLREKQNISEQLDVDMQNIMNPVELSLFNEQCLRNPSVNDGMMGFIIDKPSWFNTLTADQMLHFYNAFIDHWAKTHEDSDEVYELLITTYYKDNLTEDDRTRLYEKIAAGEKVVMAFLQLSPQLLKHAHGESLASEKAQSNESILCQKMAENLDALSKAEALEKAQRYPNIFQTMHARKRATPEPQSDEGKLDDKVIRLLSKLSVEQKQTLLDSYSETVPLTPEPNEGKRVKEEEEPALELGSPMG